MFAKSKRIIASDGLVTIDARNFIGVILEIGTTGTAGNVKVDGGAAMDSAKRLGVLYLDGVASEAVGQLHAFPVNTDEYKGQFSVTVTGANTAAVVFYHP